MGMYYQYMNKAGTTQERAMVKTQRGTATMRVYAVDQETVIAKVRKSTTARGAALFAGVEAVAWHTYRDTLYGCWVETTPEAAGWSVGG